jgi:hypothetical protein
MNFANPYTGQVEDYTTLPKPKRRFLGMQRHTYERLGAAGLIDIIEIRRPGCSRGIKLLYLPSVYAYLDGLRSAQTASSSVTKTPVTTP